MCNFISMNEKPRNASAAKEAALVPNYGLALQNKLHTASGLKPI